MKTNKINKFILILTGVLFLSSTSLFAQNGTTQGTDFWVTFGGNSGYPNANYVNLQVRIVASKATTVTYTYGDGTTSNSNLSAGVTTFSPTGSKVFTSTTGTTSKSLRIQTTEDVSVYALNQANQTLTETADASNILPANALGNEYYHLSYNSSSGYHDDGYTIIATENDTKIYENGASTPKATLQKGQVYSNYSSANQTGTHITSNKPIAYFVTNQATKIPTNGDAYDAYTSCLFQQMYPVKTWGKKILVPVTVRGLERIRVLASEAGTVITQSGGSIKTVAGGQSTLSLNAGQFVELETSNGCYISSNKPVAVCSYMLSKATGNGYQGQPAMSWIPPVEQYTTSITFATVSPIAKNGSTCPHYALIVTPYATRSETTNLSGGSWSANIGGYAFYKRSLSTGNTNNSYTFSNPNGLAVLVYGINNDETHYYPAGSGTANLANGFFVNNIYYEDVKNKTLCSNEIQLRTERDYTGVTLSANYLKWEIDGNIDNADINQWNFTKTLTTGYHTVKLIVDGDETNAASTNFTIEILTVSASAPGVAIGGTLTLTPNTGGTWVSNNEDIATVTANGTVTGVSDGLVSFTFTSNNGCSATTDKIIVATVYPPVSTNDFYVNDILYSTVNGMTFCNGEVHFRTVKDYTNEASKPTFEWIIDGSTDADGNNEWDWTKTLTAGIHTVKLVVGGNTTDAVSTTF
ncbi:MAG: Ig-like domain-containing protein, partial [Prevotellaceae bacterium]|nr:Ig-like domain-containing protein [Prevotellaceae bacterium]